MSRYGFCPVCGGRFTLKKDGTMRKHSMFLVLGVYDHANPWAPCPGAGKPPIAPILT
jgi:hypothetical protein